MANEKPYVRVMQSLLETVGGQKFTALEPQGFMAQVYMPDVDAGSVRKFLSDNEEVVALEEPEEGKVFRFIVGEDIVVLRLEEAPEDTEEGEEGEKQEQAEEGEEEGDEEEAKGKMPFDEAFWRAVEEADEAEKRFAWSKKNPRLRKRGTTSRKGDRKEENPA